MDEFDKAVATDSALPRGSAAGRRLRTAVALAIAGVSLSACIVYPAGPPVAYYPHAYYYGGYHDHWAGWR